MSKPTLHEIIDAAHPHQVLFYDGEGMCSGIMWGTKIFCACCGGVFDIDDVIESAKEDGVTALKVFDTWIDLSDEIKGDAEDSAVEVEMEDD